ITCKVTYAENCTRSSGINTVPGEAVFRINNGKIQTIKYDLTSDENTQFAAFFDKFTTWFSETYPNEWAKITTGDAWLTRETGTILGGRCKEYGAIN
ncbi:MAG: hypothetical protein ACM3PY_08440, partial [Omnitrophica WOR_2 bacterium]